MSPLRSSSALAGAHVSCALLACALLAALVVPAVAGQEREPGEDDWQPLESFDEAISVEVTSIEVWVTDRQGNPVTGLDAGDFVLTEDGERVEITNFAAYTAEESGSWTAPEGGEESSAPVALPITEIDPDNRLHLAILVDNWNLRPADRARVFEDLRELLRERMSPRDRAMVLVHDSALALVQELTDDPDALLGALARVERSATTNLSMESERRSAYRNIRFEYEHIPSVPGLNPDPCVEKWGEIRNAARQYATAVMAHTQRSVGALASSGSILSGVPGRRVMLYVGSGLPQQAGGEIFHYLAELCPQQQSDVATWYTEFDLTFLYEEVARQANANGLTLYTVEASLPASTSDLSLPDLAGPSTLDTGATASGQTMRPSTAAVRNAELDSEAGLFYVANETGGRAILNAMDFSADFARLATELRTYYSLGFAPGHGGDGQLHRIDVKLAKGVGDGWRVRHRQSYRDKPYEVRMAEKIRGVAQFGTEANRMNVRVETGQATPVGTGYRVPIRLWVPLDEMTLVEPSSGGAEGRAGRLRVMMAVSDAAGNLGPVRQKLVDVESGAAEAAGTGDTREHLVEVDLELPTPDHVVALGVRDELGGETSFVRHEIHLADEPTEAGSVTGEESR
jgi:VWFA-related protein